MGVFNAIQALMENVVLPPSLLAGLYGVLARDPAVRFDHSVTDLAGRTGVGFYTVQEGYLKEEIVVNPRTYAYMGSLAVPAGRRGSVRACGPARQGGARRPDLPHTCRVKRVSVVGNSGSGKTTLAAELGRRLAAPHLELDGVFQQPGWQPLPVTEFRARVAEFVAGDRWVVDGNYSSVQDLVWQRADTVVWLDPPRHRVMRRVIWRTLRRAISRAELWNGNREDWRSMFRIDPTQSIIAWAWTRDRIVRQRYSSAQDDPANAHLTFIRLRGDDDVAALTGRAGRD